MLTTCDCCGRERRDVKAMGRDSNGDPDAPAMCFICRKEWESRKRVWSPEAARYMTEYELYGQEAP